MKKKRKTTFAPLLPSSHSLNVYLCFGVQFLILPTHNNLLSTCVFVLYPLPSLHPTQPTKTTVCQPRFIIFRSLFQSKIPFFSSSCSPLQATLKPFAQALIWSRPTEKLSFWINIADDTFNISLQQSSVIVATCKKICYFQYQLMNPSVFFFFVYSISHFIRCTERENWSFLQSYFLMQCRFDKARGYQDPKEKCLAVNRMTLALTAVS